MYKILLFSQVAPLQTYSFFVSFSISLSTTLYVGLLGVDFLNLPKLRHSASLLICMYSRRVGKTTSKSQSFNCGFSRKSLNPSVCKIVYCVLFTYQTHTYYNAIRKTNLSLSLASSLCSLKSFRSATT